MSPPFPPGYRVAQRQSSRQSSAIRRSSATPTRLPNCLGISIGQAWERRVNKGKLIELSSLRELITEKPIRGWGEDPRQVEAVIKDDPECLAMFYEAMQITNQHDKPTNNISKQGDVKEKRNTIQGTSKAYTCERLARVAPELFEEVRAGRLSANAAAIKAGIRKKPTAYEVALKAAKKLTAEERKRLIEELSQ